MFLSQISREIKEFGADSMIPKKENWIQRSEFITLFESISFAEIHLSNLIYEGEEYQIADVEIVINKDLKFKFTYSQGQIRISYHGKLKDEIIDFCFEVSTKLNAYLLSDVNTLYPPEKIAAARARLSKKLKKSQTKYQIESFGINNIWLAFKSDINTVKSYFNLKGKKLKWDEALNEMEQCNGMFLFEQNGWAFLAGQLVDSIFKCKGESEKEIEAEHVARLLEWGKSFSEFQLFMHYDRSTYFDAFYRIVNGKMIYGTYYTESYEKEYGKMPNELKLLAETNAISASGVWSINPDSLRYAKSTLEGAWVVKQGIYP